MIAKIILIAMSLISFGRSTAQHGQKKTGQHNGYISFVALIVLFILYYQAGIFKNL